MTFNLLRMPYAVLGSTQSSKQVIVTRVQPRERLNRNCTNSPGPSVGEPPSDGQVAHAVPGPLGKVVPINRLLTPHIRARNTPNRALHILDHT